MACFSAPDIALPATRILPAALLTGLAALPAAATTLRVDVTGTLDWSYVYDMAVDADTGDDLPGGILTAQDVPPGSPGFENRALAEATAGSLLYASDTGTFSGCTGLMTLICGFDTADPDVTATVSVDAATNSFTALLMALPDGATFEIDPTSFFYTDDYAVPDLELGSKTYFMAFPLFDGTIDSMSVTVVPLPAALPMLLAGVGALALHRRRRA